MASEEVRGSFCRDDSCVITDQLATGPGALERELLANCPSRMISCTMWGQLSRMLCQFDMILPLLIGTEDLQQA